MRQIREYCGIFGIFNAEDAARHTYYGLHALQHRGQESSGIVSSAYDETKQRRVMQAHRGRGLVLDVFADQSLFETKLLGAAAIGHNRYSTMGASDNKANIQPFVVHYKNGNLAISHNGNLSNARELRQSFSDQGTLFQTTSDTELVLHLIAQSRRSKQINQIRDALAQLEGAFSLLILTDESLIAIRDPNGFRPLSLGRLNETSWCVASETCAFDLIGAEYVRDVEPGEILVIDREGAETGSFQSYHLPRSSDISQCVFEYVYFSRPDSRIYGEMVDKVRRQIGKQLAREVPLPSTKKGEKHPIVISVPDSSNTSALGYVSECRKQGYSGKFEIGLIRNHYVGRTFIAPGQDRREMRVRCKFNTVEGVLKNRIVVIVDDSIVRGTTARYIVNMIREAGAREVHFRVAAPPVINPCYYGMDFPSHDELFAHEFSSDKERAEWLGVDSLAYLSVEGLMKAVRSANRGEAGYCNACFTGKYPVPVHAPVVKEENEW